MLKNTNKRPNRVLWGLRSFSTEAIYAGAGAGAAAAAFSNCNIKTAILFL